MTDQFNYDVFLSHSSKDKASVRPITERLRADGLCVWFDEWALKPGARIPAKIKQGLEKSRVLILCMDGRATDRTPNRCTLIYNQPELRFVTK